MPGTVQSVRWPNRVRYVQIETGCCWGKQQLQEKTVILHRESHLGTMSSDNTMPDGSRYDLVVFGATGFTGQYVVEEIARSIDEEGSLTWAIAGRSMQKLQGVLKQASKTTGNARDV